MFSVLRFPLVYILNSMLKFSFLASIFLNASIKRMLISKLVSITSNVWITQRPVSSVLLFSGGFWSFGSVRSCAQKVSIESFYSIQFPWIGSYSRHDLRFYVAEIQSLNSNLYLVFAYSQCHPSEVSFKNLMSLYGPSFSEECELQVFFLSSWCNYHKLS